MILVIAWNVAQSQCWSARLRYGVHLDECPAGRMRPELSFQVRGLRRGSPGRVLVHPRAVFTSGWNRGVERAPIRRGGATLSLVTGSSTVTLTPKDGWSRNRSGSLVGRVTLPADLPDGRHTLIARADTPLGAVESRMTLPVFAPAKILIMTDRPLYEAGNLVRFRAVVLRAKDLSPLDDRPGRWVLRAPDGTVLLEEPSKAGAYGVASGDFPLDPSAETGTWTVEWVSGEDRGSANFAVRPFELPRFVIEAQAGRPHYGPRDAPIVRGAVRYASGAPVVAANVDIEWRVDGRWPAPPKWLKGELPKRAVTDEQGRFELKLPKIPADLMGQATLRGAIAATDAAGDRVSGGVSVLLSKDNIAVSTVTELADGLVEGFNNRLYLRATTAAGRVLSNTTLRVSRAWDPSDEGQDIVTDVDGVAALQIDPGPAVTVVVPGYPVRPPLPPPPVERVSLQDHLRVSGPALADQLTLDRAPLGKCARHLSEDQQVRTVAWVSGAGVVDSVVAGDDALSACVARQLKAVRFGKGRARLFEMRHRFHWNGPTAQLLFDGPDVPPDPWRARMNALAVEARKCLSARVSGRRPGQLLGWSVDAKGRFSLRPLIEPRSGVKQPASVTQCLMRTLIAGQSPTLVELGGEASPTPATGIVRVSVSPAPSRRTQRRQSTTYLGYELKVVASAGAERIGETKVRLRPGRIPPLRLRATPVVAKAGDTVEVKALRGPDFSGELPKKLVLVNEGLRIPADFDPQTRIARFVLPKDRSGWYEARYQDARAVVFVPDLRALDVAVSSDKPKYPPGAQARLTVNTAVDGKGAAAMVGLFGVDQSLGQLAPLPGPDTWSKMLTPPTLTSPAFGSIDAVALASGRVKGAAALAATVLRVNQVPASEALDRSLNLATDERFDPVIPMTDAFYELLARLMVRVRKWDGESPKTAIMTPATMADLWDEVVAAAPESVRDDPFGRRMRLRILPDDLLALVDPRVVVTNGTRLPEDVDNWIRWVRRNQR